MRENTFHMRQCIPQLGALLLCCSLATAQSSTPADAMALEQQQKWNQAAQVWTTVTQRNPNDAAAFASLGLDLAHEGADAS